MHSLDGVISTMFVWCCSAYRALSTAMYNALAPYHPTALPSSMPLYFCVRILDRSCVWRSTVSYPFSRAWSSGDPTLTQFDSALEQNQTLSLAAFQILRFLLPERALATGL